jgi:hypothetical protein
MIHWLGLLAGTALALHPVKDFRTASLQNQKGISKQNVAVQVPAQAQALAASYTVSTVSTLPSLAPTIAVSDKVQYVLTDVSQSIYYINTTFTDIQTQYEQAFQLLLDSGSDLTWIYNQSCSSGACTRDLVPKFDDSRNITSGDKFELSYSGDSVSGDVVSTSSSDKTVFAFGSLQLTSFEFGLADEAPTIFNDFNVSGILGIPSQSDDQRSMFSQLYNEKLIDEPVFSLALVASNQQIEYSGNASAIPDNYGGLMFFGSEVAKNQKTFTDSVKYLDIQNNDNAYWLVNVTDIKLSNDSYSGTYHSSESSLQAIIDTGTTGMALPMDDANNLHSILFGSSSVTDNKGNYAFPCDADANVTISLDGQEFSISVSDFKGEEYGSQLEGYCASKVQGLEDNNYWILGSIFLRRYYAIFDIEKHKIGLGVNNLLLYKLKEVKQSSASATSSILPSSTRVRVNSTSSQSTKHSKTSLANSSGLMAGLSYALLCMFAYLI